MWNIGRHAGPLCAAALMLVAGIGLDMGPLLHGGVPGPAEVRAYPPPVPGQPRRVARRTARRTSARHNAYNNPVTIQPVPAPRPVAGAAVAGAAVATAAAAVAIGSRVAALPAGCARVSSGGQTLYNCGGTWYQPVYDGPDVVYVVVNPPR